MIALSSGDKVFAEERLIYCDSDSCGNVGRAFVDDDGLHDATAGDNGSVEGVHTGDTYSITVKVSGMAGVTEVGCMSTISVLSGSLHFSELAGEVGDESRSAAGFSVLVRLMGEVRSGWVHITELSAGVDDESGPPPGSSVPLTLCSGWLHFAALPATAWDECAAVVAETSSSSSSGLRQWMIAYKIFCTRLNLGGSMVAAY